MAKLFSKDASKMFSEALLGTLDRERKLKEQRDQFNRDIAFRRRSLDLLNIYRQETLKQNATQEERLRQGEIADLYTSGFRPDGESPDVTMFGQGLDFPMPKQEPVKQSRLKNYQGGVIEEQYYPSPEGDVITGYENIFSPDRSGGKEPTTPYYDLTKSGEIFKKYRQLQSGTPIKTEDDQNAFNITDFEHNKVATLNQQEIEKLKRQGEIDLKESTDNEARQINSKVPGFYSTFQAFLSIIKSPDEIDKVVNENLGGIATETRDAMKTLLKRRIFK